MAKRGKLPTCSKCGCTDARGCPPDRRGISCWWITLAPPLCSRCIGPQPRKRARR